MNLRRPSLSGWRRDVAVVATGRAVSLAGDEVVVIALLLRASDRPGGAGLVAGLLVAAALPSLLLAPVSGLLVDRLPARLLVSAVSLVQAALCATLLLVDEPLAVLAVVFAINAGQTVAGPAWQALVPSVVPREHLAGALSTIQAASAAAGMLGPALGGLLVGLGGTGLALAVDAASFLALVVAAASLRGDRVPEAGSEADGSLVREALAGFRHVAREPMVRALVLLVGVFVLVLGAVNVAEIFLVTDVLGAGPLVYGLLGAVFAAGSMAGAAASRAERSEAQLARGVVVACLVMAGGIALLGLAPVVLVAGVASAVVGFGNARLNVQVQQLVIRRTPREMLGRVFAALQAVGNTSLLVALGLGGAALTAVGPRLVVLAAAAATVIGVVATMAPLVRRGVVPPPRAHSEPADGWARMSDAASAPVPDCVHGPS